MESLSRTFIIIGVVFILIGLYSMIGGRFSFFGNLPLDFKFEKENFKFYFPFGTSILLSILISLLFWFIRKF